MKLWSEDRNFSSISKKDLITFYNSSDEYLEDLKSCQGDSFYEYLAIVMQNIDRYLKTRNIKLLELGCGLGYSSYCFSQHLKEVVGTDISSKFIKFASKSYIKENLSYRVEDAVSLSFQDEEFDVAVAFDFIEHCYNVRMALNEVSRVIKKDGLIIIVSPNLCSFYWPIRNLFASNKHMQEKFSLAWTLKSLYILLKKIFSSSSNFVYKQPILDVRRIGLDFDSVYLSNPIDIRKFLKQKGFEILRGGRLTFKARLAEKLLGFFSPSFLVIFRKPLILHKL